MIPPIGLPVNGTIKIMIPPIDYPEAAQKVTPHAGARVGLFEPMRAGALRLANRVWLGGIGACRADEQGAPADGMLEFYLRRCSAGLMITEPVLAGVGSGLRSREPRLCEEMPLNSWRALAKGVREQGGRVALQLWAPDTTQRGQEALAWARDLSHVARLGRELGFEAVEWLIPQSWLRRSRELENLLPLAMEATGSGRLAVRINLNQPLTGNLAGLQVLRSLAADHLAWIRVVCGMDLIRPWEGPLRQWTDSMRCPLALPARQSRGKRSPNLEHGGIHADALTFGSAFVENPDLTADLAAGRWN